MRRTLFAHAPTLLATFEARGVCAMSGNVPKEEQKKMYQDGCLWNTTRCSKAMLKVVHVL